MEVSLLAQFFALLAALFFGLGLGILYDIYRVFLVLFGLLRAGEPRPLPRRLPLLPKKWLLPRKGTAGKRLVALLLFLLDTLFAVTAGIFFVIFLYVENDGIFRFYLLVGAAMSFSLYLLTVGKLVFRMAEILAFYLHIGLLYLAYVLSLPFLLLLRFFVLAWKKLFRPLAFSLFTPLVSRVAFFLLSRRFGRDLSSVAKAIKKNI